MRFPTSIATYLAPLFLIACAQQPIKNGLSSNPDLGGVSRIRNADSLTVVRAKTLRFPVVRAFPKFPSDLASQGISGAVLVAYVIDTTGRVELGSESLLLATHREFADAVCSNLPKIRYQPFLVANRKARILVVQLHEFVAPGGSSDSPELVDALKLQERAEDEFSQTPIAALVDELERLPHCAAR